MLLLLTGESLDITLSSMVLGVIGSAKFKVWDIILSLSDNIEKIGSTYPAALDKWPIAPFITCYIYGMTMIYFNNSQKFIDTK